jgi:hypothetical protein
METEYPIIDRIRNKEYDKKTDDKILKYYKKQVEKATGKNYLVPKPDLAQTTVIVEEHVYKKWILRKLKHTLTPMLWVPISIPIIFLGILWLISPYAKLLDTHWQFDNASKYIFFATNILLLFIIFVHMCIICNKFFFLHIFAETEVLTSGILQSNDKTNLLERQYVALDCRNNPKRLYNIKTNKTELTEEDKRYSYVAISHAWPKGNNYKKTIKVCGCDWQVPVFRNINMLNEFIRTIDSIIINTGIEYLWLDVLCVPQGKKHEKERDKEIKFLGEYYRNAAFCFAFIGGIEQKVLKWNEFLNDRWYKRVWTLQEACLNENTYIVSNIIHSSLFDNIFKICFKSGLSSFGSTQRGILIHIDYLVELVMEKNCTPYGRAIILQAYTFKYIRNIIKDIPDNTFNLIGLDMLANRKCKKGKDKVFGIIGICSKYSLDIKCEEDISFKTAVEDLIKALESTPDMPKDVTYALGLCNMSTIEWLCKFVITKREHKHSWINNLGKGNMGFSGISGTYRITGNSLCGKFVICPVCPLYWFGGRGNSFCNFFIPRCSKNKVYTFVNNAFMFGLLVLYSMLIVKISYKIVLAFFVYPVFIVIMLSVLIIIFALDTSNGGMLDTNGRVVGIFHCQNMILNFSKQLVLIISCDSLNKTGLVAGNICYVKDKDTFCAIYGINVLMLRDVEGSYPVIHDGKII